jgi:DNA-binding NtrC family response regulator
LNVVPVELPALQDRTEDIDALIKHFLHHFSNEYNIVAPIFSRQALKALRAYQWPGNIRELRNLCERLSILLAGRVIEPENLPYEFISSVSKIEKSNFTLPALGLQLEELEADLIHQALTRTNGNRSKSARLLGISRDTLLYRIQKYGLAAS